MNDISPLEIFGLVNAVFLTFCMAFSLFFDIDIIIFAMTIAAFLWNVVSYQREEKKKDEVERMEEEWRRA